MIEVKNARQGECPKCKSFDIEYFTPTLDGDHYDYFCRCNDCKTEFCECYTLNFDGVYMED